jgi:hypothetical protein
MNKILLKVNTTTGAITDWQDQPAAINLVNGDTVLLCLHFVEALTSTLTAVNLTGATALRAMVKAARLESSAVLTFQDSYNTGLYPACEVLASGYVTWAVSFNAAAIDSAIGSLESLAAWLELSWLGTDAYPQTLAQIPITIYQQLDDGAPGTPPPTTPTYLTAAEVVAAYARLSGTADIEITDATKGIILKDSVTAARIRLTLADGAITLTTL